MVTLCTTPSVARMLWISSSTTDRCCFLFLFTNRSQSYGRQHEPVQGVSAHRPLRLRGNTGEAVALCWNCRICCLHSAMTYLPITFEVSNSSKRKQSTYSVPHAQLVSTAYMSYRQAQPVRHRLYRHVLSSLWLQQRRKSKRARSTGACGTLDQHHSCSSFCPIKSGYIRLLSTARRWIIPVESRKLNEVCSMSTMIALMSSDNWRISALMRSTPGRYGNRPTISG